MPLRHVKPYPVSLFLWLILTLALPLHAQTQSKDASAITESVSATTPDAPENVTLTLITDQAIITQRMIEQLTPLFTLPAAVQALQTGNKDSVKTFETLKKNTVKLLDDPKTRLDQLKNTQSEWKLLVDNLQPQQQLLRNHASEIENALALASEEETRWQTIKTKIPQIKGADTYKTVQRALDDLSNTKKRLNIPLKEILSLTSDCSLRIDSIADHLLSLRQRERSARKDLFGNIQPPLWELSADDFRVQNTILSTLQQQIKFTRHFLEKNIVINFVLIAYVIAIFILLWRLKTRQGYSSTLEQGQHLRFALLDRPFSTNIATSALLALILYQHTPALLQITLTLLLFIPVVRLGLPLITQDFRLLVWCISLLYVINNVTTLGEIMPAAHRLWVVLCSGFTAVIMRHALIQLRKNSNKTGLFWRNVYIAGGSSIVLSLVALTSGALGVTNLAEFLNMGMVNVAYSALCLTVVTGIVIDLLTSALYLPSLAASYLVRRNRHLLTTKIKQLTIAAGALGWFGFVLKQFYLDEPLLQTFKTVFNASFAIGNISFTLGSLLSIGIIFWLSLKLSRLIRFVLIEDIAPRTGMSRGAPEAMATISHYIIILIGFMVAISAAGIDMSKFAIMAGALGVGIGIGLQDVVNNFTSGLMLLFEHHIKPGDVIQCGTVHGHVVNIGLRCSVVRAFDGSEVIVPNSQLASAQVINWTHSDQQRRITISVGVAYGTDPQRVIDHLLEIAKAEPHVLQDPPPQAFFLNFGTSSMDFELRVWIRTPDVLMETTSGLCISIAQRFRDQNISIPFSQHDIYIHTPKPTSGNAPA